MNKQIKDPLYGYIEISNEYLKNIVDTPSFQRLRNIRQTSYESVFPNALHNRFIHSLGVFHLGKLAVQALRRNCTRMFSDSINNKDWDCLEQTFLLACLTHDAAHAPFSHTGEQFYKTAKCNSGDFQLPENDAEIYTDLIKAVFDYMGIAFNKKSIDNNAFCKDFRKTLAGDGPAQPHEIMSVILAIETYAAYFKKVEIDIDLFARAIIGLPISGDDKILKTAVKNALIRLLNSKIIDVDRLDYLLRDNMMTGFQGMSIDYGRLLAGVCIIKDTTDGRFLLAFKKGSISVIENVVIAHDAARKWIQSHPTIMYDSFLISSCVDIVDRAFKNADGKHGLICKGALMEKGITTSKGNCIRLMTDDDLIHLAKQCKNADGDVPLLIEEYFSRVKRKKPIWKSESEYSLILGSLTLEGEKIFTKVFLPLSEKEVGIGTELNANRIKALEDEVNVLAADNALDEEFITQSLLEKYRYICWMQWLEVFANQNNLFFEYSRISTNHFDSNMKELSKSEILIYYEGFDSHQPFNKAIKSYASNGNADSAAHATAGGSKKKDVFYLFVSPKDPISFNTAAIQSVFVEFLSKAVSADKKIMSETYTKEDIVKLVTNSNYPPLG